ncbi:MAG: type II secretion system F family protein [Actinomycetota bacterium]
MKGALLAACCTTSAVVLLGAAATIQGRDRLLGRMGEEPSPSRGGHPSIGLPRAVIAMGAGGLGAVLGALVAGPPGIVLGLAAAAFPFLVDRHRVTRRAQLIEEQLIDGVGAIASALRSGKSLVQSLEVAADEVDAPLGVLLTEGVDRSSLGVPFEDVLDGLAERIGTPDARLVTGVLRLHRRTGGALAASLDDVTRTLRARRDGARELRSLTAQARLSAAILGLLPVGFFLFLLVVARRDVETAYRTTAGAAAIGIGLALQGLAFVWIRRLLRVEEA